MQKQTISPPKRSTAIKMNCVTNCSYIYLFDLWSLAWNPNSAV